MQVEYLLSKNNEKTCKINSIFLHSSYNPSREAQNFVKNLNIQFIPSYIVILEAGLGYVLPYLKERFPESKIILIRYCNEFDYDKSYTCLNYQNIDELSKIIPEIDLFSTIFLTWEASAKIFKDINDFTGKKIKDILSFAKTSLITRQYFEKKWLLNSCNFIRYVKKFTSFTQKINNPVLICASGPSLFDLIPYLKENQNKFFIIALSSAISVLNRYSIKADLYMTSDGGFWANYHLRKSNCEIPLAITVEAYANKRLLSNQNILPLIYNDGISSSLKNITNINFMNAVRNGTISGSALEFASSITNQNIFFTGLDLFSNKGFQHCQPNELTLLNLNKFTRINNQETYEYKASLNSESLKIYESWFKQYKIKNQKIYRIINKDKVHNNLNQIKDLQVSDFIQMTKNQKEKDKIIFQQSTRNEEDIKNDCQNYLKFLFNPQNLQEIQRNIFPLDIMNVKKFPDNLEFREKLENESKKLFNKIKGILNE